MATKRNQKPPPPPTILVVEDEEADVLLIERTLSASGVPNRLAILRDGREAIMYLAGEGAYSNRNKHPMPALVLLDLSLPGMDGLQVLTWVRQQAALQDLKVIVLTGSFNPEDSNAAYRLGATTILLKGFDSKQFQNVVLRVLQYLPAQIPLPKKTGGAQMSGPAE